MKHLVLSKQSDSSGDMIPSIRILASSSSEEKLLGELDKFIMRLSRKFGYDYESVEDYLDSDDVLVKSRYEGFIDFTDYNDEHFYTLSICEDKVI